MLTVYGLEYNENKLRYSVVIFVGKKMINFDEAQDRCICILGARVGQYSLVNTITYKMK